MVIDVRDILKASGLSKDVAFSVPAGDCGVTDAAYTFPEPLSVSAALTNIRGIIRATGQVRVVYETCCARCLKPLRTLLEKPFDEEFLPAAALRATDELYAYTGREIHMGTLLRDAVLLELPIRRLCREDCKALCPVCGHDLNDGDCGCDRSLVMTRLGALIE
jgi:uncharacterized protein